MNNQILEEMPAACYSRRPKNLPRSLTEMANCGMPSTCAITRIYAELVRKASGGAVQCAKSS